MMNNPGYAVCVSLSGAAHRRLGPRWGIYLFPSTMVAAEWMQHTLTPFGTWGSLAYTQVDYLPLLQLASLAGLTGISFLVALASSLAAAAYTLGPRAVAKDILLFTLLLVAILAYGEIRLGSPAPGTPVRVAAVTTPVTVPEIFASVKDPGRLRARDDELFRRTNRAAALGASVAVWNEVATLLKPDDEQGFTDRARRLAREKRISLVMAYGVVLSTSPFKWENKYRFILSDGTLADEYFKRHPVPVDANVHGTRHARIVSLPEGNLGGAICYDLDFPHIARDNANDGVGLILAPSSDWRGIDPIHTQMARANALAAGVSLLRPVRGAVSIASDQYGRTLATMPYENAGDGVMVAAVPARKAPTLYARTGDLLPLVGIGVSLCAVALMARRKEPWNNDDK